MDNNNIEMKEKVRQGYTQIAKEGVWNSSEKEQSSCCGGGGCCGPTSFSPEELVKAVGYSSAELEIVPEGANMGLSCGNPTALAALKEGEVLFDLGSGGGFDCFIAGPKVGKTGRVIGVDMTAEMLHKARLGLEVYRKHTGLDNVEFRLGEIEFLPVADSSIDAVISNCVINLSPDKPQVWKEIARVLKSGGRVAVSDLALLKPLPDSVVKNVEALVGCVSGAVLVEDTKKMAEEAGLTNITLNSKTHYIDAMTNWEDPLYKNIVAELPPGSKISDYVTSLEIIAQKK